METPVTVTRYVLMVRYDKPHGWQATDTLDSEQDAIFEAIPYERDGIMYRIVTIPDLPTEATHD